VISSALYHHLDIPSPVRSMNELDGIETNRKLKHVVSDFIQSDTYKDIKETFIQFREKAQTKGVVVAWNDLVRQFDHEQECCWEDPQKSSSKDTCDFDARYTVFLRIFGHKRTSYDRLTWLSPYFSFFADKAMSATDIAHATHTDCKENVV